MPTVQSLSLYALLCASCAAPIGVHAQTSAAMPSTAADADAVTGEEIVVFGRAEAKIGVAHAASEGTVSGADLLVRPLLRTAELLEAVPGMVAAQHSGSGKANQYFLRGFNLDHGSDFTTYYGPWSCSGEEGSGSFWLISAIRVRFVPTAMPPAASVQKWIKAAIAQHWRGNRAIGRCAFAEHSGNDDGQDPFWRPESRSYTLCLGISCSDWHILACLTQLRIGGMSAAFPTFAIMQRRVRDGFRDRTVD